ncbi:MAG: hypothetical protein ACMUIE_07910 [Thermoplasmatota archaeon]
MAKRRIIREEAEEHKEEDKRPAFKPSEFDETEFLQTENLSAKMIYISLGVALLAGLVSYGIMTASYYLGVGPHLILPIASPVVFVALVLHLFRRFGIDIKEVQWKKWLENGFMYALAWFVVWMLSMNPPFSDFSDPQIDDLVVVVETGSGKEVTYIHTDDQIIRYVDDVEKEFQTISDQTDVTGVWIYTPITDNWDLEKVEVEIQENREGGWKTITDPGLDTIQIGWNDSFHPEKNVSRKVREEWLKRSRDVWKEHLYGVHFDFTDLSNKTYETDDGIYIKVIFTASDSRGNDAVREIDFKVNP